MDGKALRRLKRSTGLTEKEIMEKYEDFTKQFSEKGMTPSQFRRLSCAVLDESEVDNFTRKVFKMFYEDQNRLLTFEEFLLATENMKANPLMKLSWLFDNVYDQNSSGFIERDELSKVLIYTLLDECYTGKEAKEMVALVFDDLDLDDDNLISKREFLMAASGNESLMKILCNAAEAEQKIKKKKEIKGAGEVGIEHATAALAVASIPTGGHTEPIKKDKKKKKKKKKDKKEKGDILDKYISVSRGPSRDPSPSGFRRMSRRKSIF